MRQQFESLLNTLVDIKDDVTAAINRVPYEQEAFEKMWQQGVTLSELPDNQEKLSKFLDQLRSYEGNARKKIQESGKNTLEPDKGFVTTTLKDDGTLITTINYKEEQDDNWDLQEPEKPPYFVQIKTINNKDEQPFTVISFLTRTNDTYNQEAETRDKKYDMDKLTEIMLTQETGPTSFMVSYHGYSEPGRLKEIKTNTTSAVTPKFAQSVIDTIHYYVDTLEDLAETL